MAQSLYTYAHLTPEQERLLKEAEATLGANVLLAFSKAEYNPVNLNDSQLECLLGLEKKTGLTVIAVKPK